MRTIGHNLTLPKADARVKSAGKVPNFINPATQQRRDVQAGDPKAGR